MKNYEEIIKMFNLNAGEDEIYFNNKGEVEAENVEITNDYTWSEAAGMLYGSECDYFIVLRDGINLTEEEYEKFNFKFNDKSERYNESGQEYGKNKSYEYYNQGINLSGCEVYILYNNYNNNNIDSYNVDIYTIK